MNNKITYNASIAFLSCGYDPYSCCVIMIESRKLQHHSLTFYIFLCNASVWSNFSAFVGDGRCDFTFLL